MATCFRCGAPNADYRRNTFTGSSTSSWWSKRSYGSGSRTYYGIRSVCHNCAKSIDTWNRAKLIFWVIVIAIVILVYSTRSTTSPKRNASSQLASSYHSNGETARIISTKGLNLRDTPNSNGTILLTIPYNETVIIVDKNGNSETISGQKANWVKVDYNGTIGWLWSGFIEIVPSTEY